MQLTKEQLQVILEDHKLWLENNANGKRADLIGADLRGANLIEADLRGADLSWADLSWADLRGAGLIYLKLDNYNVHVQKEHTRISYKYHTNDEWRAFNDEQISKMAIDVLEFWNKYKELIFMAMDILNKEEEKQC